MRPIFLSESPQIYLSEKVHQLNLEFRYFLRKFQCEYQKTLNITIEVQYVTYHVIDIYIFRLARSQTCSLFLL
jgi:hypothetical protein